MTPRVVRTVEELGDAQAESDWGYVVVQDAESRPWIVWDTEHGDWIATSFPSEDDPREIDGDEVRIHPPIIDARNIVLPATVLAPLSVTSEQVEVGVHAFAAPRWHTNGGSDGVRTNLTAALAAMGIPVVDGE